MLPACRSDSLTARLVLPVVGLLLAGVLVNVAFAAWLAARRAAAAAAAGEARVAGALEAARIVPSPAVLEALHALTGSHFVPWDPSRGEPGPGTVNIDSADGPRRADLAAAIESGRIDIRARPHRVATVRPAGRRQAVLVFTPQPPAWQMAWEAVWPVLTVAALTLAVLVPLSLRTTRSLATRIAAIQRHVALLAAGEYAARPDAVGGGDEVGRLAGGVDALAVALGDLRRSLVAGERQRLLGQLAAGFAHELRNAVTGAQLAIGLHRRRCTAPADESLDVATRQLAIMEEEVRGLLALGRPTEAARGRVAVSGLLAAVRDLAAPRAEHAGVGLDAAAPPDLALEGRADSLRAALVNLVLNGIEAAGRGGTVQLAATAGPHGIDLVVEDSGTGPNPAIAAALGEPFVTGKREGVGLGLAIAKAVAEEHGGALQWHRVDGRTRFVIRLPWETPEPAAPSPQECRA